MAGRVRESGEKFEGANERHPEDQLGWIQFGLLRAAGRFARSTEMVPGILEEAEPNREMRGSRSSTRQVNANPPALSQGRQFLEGIELAEQKGPRATTEAAPKSLSDREEEVGDQRGGEPTLRQIAPEEDLCIPRHPALEGGTAVVVACRDFVEDPAGGGENTAVPRPAEPEREVDVFVVGTE